MFDKSRRRHGVLGLFEDFEMKHTVDDSECPDPDGAPLNDLIHDQAAGIPPSDVLSLNDMCSAACPSASQPSLDRKESIFDENSSAVEATSGVPAVDGLNGGSGHFLCKTNPTLPSPTSTTLDKDNEGRCYAFLLVPYSSAESDFRPGDA